jgi:hypothetical protein
MSTINIRNKGLRDTFAGMLADNKIDKAEVQKLLDVANKDGKISGREKADLQSILKKAGDKFDVDARAAFATALGLEVTPGPGPGPGPVTPVTSDRVSTVTDFKKVADTFKAEVAARGTVFNTPEKAFGLFAEYAGKLKALSAGQDPRTVDAEVEKLLAAGKQSPAAGYDKVDADHDSISDLRETAMGRDAKTFEARVMGADSPAWTTTYWPSAGSGDMNQPGNPSNNLWAKEGPLGKLDKLLNARGMADKAKAVEFERKPMLGWLVGDRAEAGHFAPNSNLSEADAEMSTGIDFDGDGKLSSGVKADFINEHGQFAPVWSRSQFTPKLGTETLTRKQVTDAAGVKSFEFYKANGTKLTPDEAKNVFYANPSSDGKVDGSMGIGWWGFCDQVALAGILFKEPVKSEVVVDGVTFTKQDMLGLLTTIAYSQGGGGNDFAGNRNDGAPDTVTLKNGTKVEGKLLTDIQFRTKDMHRENGDIMVLNKVDKDLQIQKADGTTQTIKASDVGSLAREDNLDMSPMEFHKTVVEWLGDGKRAAVMDRDSGEHVWNYNFWKATLKSGTEVAAAEMPKDPGHNGPVNPDNKVVKYNMEVLLGTSTSWGNNYEYWMEYDKTGNAVNGGWLNGTSPPDFMWRPSGTPTWSGANPRNPYVDPKLVKEIYEKFMAP